MDFDEACHHTPEIRGDETEDFWDFFEYEKTTSHAIPPEPSEAETPVDDPPISGEDPEHVSSYDGQGGPDDEKSDENGKSDDSDSDPDPLDAETETPSAIAPRETRARPNLDYRAMHGVRSYNRKPAAKKGGFAARACKVDLSPIPSVPSNIYEALNGPDKEAWIASFTEELNSMRDQGVWDRPAVPPKGKKILPGRWVLTLKLDSMGAIARFKARWVAKGFHQIEGIDFHEIYSGVIRGTCWKILFALGAKYGYEIEHSDVVIAFLEAIHNDEVWVEQPHEFTNGNPKEACKLNRALYGLKQSARDWYDTFRTFFKSLGYTRLCKEHSIFVHENGTIVAVYVDDLFMLAPTKDLINKLKQQLDGRFRMKHLGDISWYLGMEVKRERPNRTIFVNQASYSRQLIAQLDMSECHPAATPMDKGTSLVAAPDGYITDPKEAEAYRSLIGALQWLVTMTRPDLAYSVGICARFTHNPTTEHFNTAKRIIRYLAGTIDLGLRFGPHSDKSGDLIGWTDSSWADCRDTSRATSGYVFQLWNGPIVWSSKRQSLVSDSSAEAEYIGQANAAKEAMFLTQLLDELGYEGDDLKPVKLMADNQSAIKLANNPVNHQRTKHIRSKYHLVRELVSETKELMIGYVNTKDMVADVLTKPLAPELFKAFPNMLGLDRRPDGSDG